MKSFRQTMLAICVILIASAFAGCGADTDLPDKRPALERIEYTNLNDSGSREHLQELLADAGVPDGRIQSFFRRAAKKTGARGFQPSSWICTSKSVACQTIPHFFFSINKTRSTQLNFRLCAPGFAAWIGVHRNVQKFMSVFAVKGCSLFVRGIFLFSRSQIINRKTALFILHCFIFLTEKSKKYTV